MKRFIEGENRFQATLFPESLDDYIAEDNPVRVIDAFVNALDLRELGFERAEPSATGRPAYDPAVMLKIYVYGYMNRLRTTRILEQETHRNVDLIWLTGRLMPDHKTIGEFRRKNRKAIRRVCSEFVGICRQLKLFSRVIVAIDGSKFKAVNSRDKNFTRKSLKRRQQRLDEHIRRYLAILDEADKREPPEVKYTAEELAEKIASMEAEVKRLNEIEAEVEASPDKQVSLTDPDSRSMAKAGGGSEVGYNVQAAVDTKHHLIVEHEVTNAPSDRGQLAAIAKAAKTTMQRKQLTVLADKGYYSGAEILACHKDKIRALVPKADTSTSKAQGRFGKSDFIYDAERDEYICPARQRLTYGFDTNDKGRIRRVYIKYGCSNCPLRAKCTTNKHSKRIMRWKHEHVLDTMAAALAEKPDAMKIRKQTVEHTFGTIKHWMGATHFVTKRLPNVQAEMSLHVLAYNLKRMIQLFGVPRLIEVIQAA
jgi:transposase